MTFLDVSGISVEEEGNTVLKNISFTQNEFQHIAIAGETGSGKSTLLQTIAGLVQPAKGNVLFDGERVVGPQEVLVPGHPDIAYLSQQYELPQFLRVEQVLKYANILPASEAEKLYDICQIKHLLTRKTNQLSGGEKQRIALARLLTSSPRLLLLDEPFSNLDMVHKNTLKEVIEDISEHLEITCILISHDPADTLSWAEEILVMRNGQLVQKGTPAQVYYQPVNTYVAGLFGKYNLLTATQAKAFSSLKGANAAGKRILVRPEFLRLSANKDEDVAGKVKKVHFFGSHYELEVILGKATLTLKTMDNSVQAGDKVYVTVLPEGIWAV
ncbi:ABC transporter ATP-binding protein [Pontibacter cellulosilyticus]|uniref:ABC transporter ATP-binding protein n=1 Tax=Pontibacter cellulosilyticus TaxID=1720253 RepID=A0A923NAS0_9BACT|nr:ABC transporter ATP-binding protein [Pontibacter cellulosilyticus]MBC5994486.1 ABC transporter ATP-binding protein [Pontibacter cellulosilyticus]